MWQKLGGYKTYAVAAIMVAYGVVVEGLYNNNWNAAGQTILAALGIAGLRNAIPTK